MTRPAPSMPVTEALKLKRTHGGARGKGAHYQTGLPFVTEYIDSVLRPRVIAIVAEGGPYGAAPKNIKDFRRRFRETYKVQLSETKCADILKMCGLMFTRQAVLIQSNVLRNKEAKVPQALVPPPPILEAGAEIVAPEPDELAGPTFRPDPAVRFDNEGPQ